MLFQMMKVGIFCSKLRLIRMMDQQVEPGAVQVALNERVELVLMNQYQLVNRIGKCVQEAASFFTIDAARRHGLFNLCHGLYSWSQVTAIGIPFGVRQGRTAGPLIG